jgi:hypothetical protein
MAVRPPQQGGDEPETLTFGIAALDAYLTDADVLFPTTAQDLLQELNDPSIAYDASGNTVPLSEVLESVEEQKFENKTELLNALHPVFEEYRVTSSNGILAQLRSLLPF